MRSSLTTPSIVRSPPVTAASPMKLATSTWSGPIVHSPPRRLSTPLTRRTFDSIPSICAPSEPRNRHRSCTWGSQAALPIDVSPSARAAAMTMFSVAITLASSRKTLAPRTRSVRMSYASPASTSTPSLVKPWMCGSSLRLPMTSPPGGATVAAPARTSSGPASRNEARICEQRSRSSSVLRISAAWTRTSFGPIHWTSAPRSSMSASIVSTSRIRGTLCRTTGSLVITHAARMGSTPFLLPAAVTRPWRGWPPSITNDSVTGLATTVSVMGEGAMVLGTLEVTRDRAWETLTRYTTSEALLRHALAVEASVRAYAQKFGEDEELWGATALLHDFDYEIHPTLDKHPQDGAPILREEGYPEVVIEGVLSHAEHLAMLRDTPLKKTLFACDELSGFIHACGLVRPDGLAGLEPKSVKKKLKQPSFAAGVNRDDVYKGAEELGVELDDHIRFVIGAMRPISGELGLRSAADVPAG